MCSCIIVTEASESQDTKPSSDGVKMIEKSEHVCLLWLLINVPLCNEALWHDRVGIRWCLC